jgi:hypothetical protein
MLEQAIVDAAALREAALKNAEQSIIEKYAPEIKAAVETLLETTEDTKAINEQEMPPEPEAAIEAPFAAADVSPGQEVELEMEFDFDPSDFQLDLDDIKQMKGEDPESEGEQPEETGDLMSDLGLGGEEETAEDELPALQEILDILDEEEVLEEELVVDVAGQHKNGTIETNEATLEYQQEMELAKRESTKIKEENEELEAKIKDLQESVDSYETKNKELYSAVRQLKNKLEESMLSNAKLIYSNRILSDASLNERQKIKIVEAIAQAKSKDEAKSLCETLKATVGSTKDNGPKSLSESVQRKSNLSNILQRSKRNINENKDHGFADRMKALAGISKT